MTDDTPRKQPAMLHVMTAAEVASALQCSEETVHQAAADGRLPGIKWGRGWVFPVAQLERRLNELAEKETAARVSRRRSVSAREVRSAEPPRLPVLHQGAPR